MISNLLFYTDGDAMNNLFINTFIKFFFLLTPVFPALHLSVDDQGDGTAGEEAASRQSDRFGDYGLHYSVSDR